MRILLFGSHCGQRAVIFAAWTGKPEAFGRIFLMEGRTRLPCPVFVCCLVVNCFQTFNEL